MTKAEKVAVKKLRMAEIENYTAAPSAPVYKKMLKGFLHRDSMADKEAVFRCIEPFITKFRACANCETPSERAFWSEYLYWQIRLYKWTPGYMLAPQMEIKGTVAKVKPYRADFVNDETKTIIEINGGIHDKQRPYDRKRTERLNELGYTVIVFSNEEIEQDCGACVQEVLKIIDRRLARKTEDS